METFVKRYGDALRSQQVTGRMDFELHDLKAVDKSAVRVLATYASVLGTPTPFDVQNWLTTKLGDFSNKVQARMDTVAIYPERNFVTFIVEPKVARLPLSASLKMFKAGIDQFVDTSDLLWEVVKPDSGSAYLVRKEAASVEQMLEVRKQALRGTHTHRSNVTLAAVDSIPGVGGGFASVSLGDLVDFYHDGLIKRGRISSLNATGFSISTSSGSFGGIDPHAVIAVVERSAAADKEQDDVIRRYYSMLYPANPEMVELISPSSSVKVEDKRPLQVTPMSQMLGASARPTQRVSGKRPLTRMGVVSAKVKVKR